MSVQSGSKWVYVFAFLLLAGGLGYLLVSGLSSNSVYFLNVSEALAMETQELGQARLFGTVAAQGIERNEDAMGVRFALQDKENKDKVIWVEYSGVVPDTFKPGVEVIVEGSLARPEGVFGAHNLMTKCPSKYKKEEQG
ncbi:cytochrome c maturation protein CcmE [Desulfohalobium retbaense]|uniref:Cytochrome c-type biogenesis protein CcmE n=1 Tax=Desulfohalobium retbaense (strain ATCC 49708 / DSM 5692 / JCM 16813 / HR100) TaxID=485915 RepID=C8X1H2_DESRD|nr:cytochrome c maturation protein CcmE [Desulfohalobium retbaense]ACV68269.1 cytochrome c-type biogenesis protein CcmE [Desulfohalobium retbaense DSM 5692]